MRPANVLLDFRRQLVELARRAAALAGLRESGADSVETFEHENPRRSAAENRCRLFPVPLLRCVCNQSIARER
jgi:hypothetical protein